MSKYLILHGTGGSPDSNWFTWLKGKLIGQGHEVWLPQLPDAGKPNAQKYSEFLLDNKNFTLDDNTIIIGHSSGAVAALFLLQNLPEKTKLKGTILVSAFKDDLGWDSLEELFFEPLNFEAIKAHCKRFIFLHSEDDPHCPIDHAEYLSLKTGGELIVFEGQGHFNTELGPQYKQFPEILDFIDEINRT